MKPPRLPLPDDLIRKNALVDPVALDEIVDVVESLRALGVPTGASRRQTRDLRPATSQEHGAVKHQRPIAFGQRSR